MKRIKQISYIIFLITACHALITHTLSATHTLFIPLQATCSNGSHFSTYQPLIKKEYRSPKIRTAYNINTIKQWVAHYNQPKPIPYVYLQQAPNVTIDSDPIHNVPEEMTEIPIPCDTNQPSYIAALEDALFIQQQCPEWEKHIEIINARRCAVDADKHGNHKVTTQQYSISHKMQRYCDAYDVDSNKLKQCTGSIIQQTIHHEFIEITKKSSRMWHIYNTVKPFKKAAHIIADFTNAGIEYNNNNELPQALHLANACWMILDCVQAASEGLVDGAYHIIDDIIHPVRTVQNIAESAAICGYYIGKVAYEIVGLGYLAIIEPPDRTREKLEAWKHNFSLIYDAIQEKCATLKTRDIVKETVSIGVQCYTAPKVFHGLGTLFKQAQKHITAFAKNIPALAKTNALTTPEGVIVRIADGTAEYMKSEHIANNIEINKLISPNEISTTKNPFGRTHLDIENPVLNNLRSGSALKQDALHAFSDIIDNYATYAKEFDLIGSDGCIYKLYQIEGSLNGKSGIFEWIIHPDPIRGVTHRRFIADVPITGKPNAIKKRL